MDIWHIDSDTNPVQTYTLPNGVKTRPSIQLAEDGSTLVSSYQRFVDILHRRSKDLEFSKVHQLEAESDVSVKL